MDLHADTCVAGPNFKTLEFTGEQCDVTTYTNDYEPIINVPVVNAATAFTDELTWVTVTLRLNQGAMVREANENEFNKAESAATLRCDGV
jgi:hypothetical protein